MSVLASRSNFLAACYVYRFGNISSEILSTPVIVLVSKILKETDIQKLKQWVKI